MAEDCGICFGFVVEPERQVTLDKPLQGTGAAGADSATTDGADTATLVGAAGAVTGGITGVAVTGGIIAAVRPTGAATATAATTLRKPPRIPPRPQAR